MARKAFIGFDYLYDATTATTGHGVMLPYVAPALPPGVSAVSKISDTQFFPPGWANVNAYSTFIVGRDSRSSSFGHGAWANLSFFQTNSAFATGSIAVTRASIGNPQEIWTTFDIRIANPSQNVDDPATFMQSAARYQIFKWGDLSLRIRRVFGYQASPLTHTWQFEAFNGATSLGTITPTAYTTSQFAFVRIRARLDSGTNGLFEVMIDGVSLNTTGINTVATTALVDATTLYFSGGFLGLPNSSSGWSFMGSIDNILIDDAAFPSGRPIGARVTLSSDGTLTNWAANGAASITAALTGAGTARGTGTGATALINFSAVVTTGWETDLIGWQIAANGISNLDPVILRKLRTGIDLSGTPYNGTDIDDISPPLSPSSMTVGNIVDTVFYKGGATNFVLSDITNCKARLEVVV